MMETKTVNKFSFSQMKINF